MVAFGNLAYVQLAIFPGLSLAHSKSNEATANILDLHRRTAAAGSQALAQCNDTIEARLSNEASAGARVETLNALRRNIGLEPVSKLDTRDLGNLQHWEDKSVVNHDKTGHIGNINNAWAQTKPQCAFVPEDTVGPYYYPGELVRSEIAEGLPGVPLWLEVQLMYVNNCQPIQQMTVDIWATNADGHYSHIPTSAGQAGIDTHWQRGALPTDNNGLALFKMIFPGHYDGRATHVHGMARDAGRANNGQSVTGDGTQANVHHIGQVYFDESLRADVERTFPYNINMQKLVSNDDDGFAKNQATSQYDPFLNYAHINGQDINGGVYAWISIGIDPKASKPQTYFPSGRPWRQ